MKVITSFTIRWDDPELNTLEEESYEYEGPVAQCGGGGSNQAYYDQLNSLYGIQADQAQYLMGVAKDTVIPAYKDFVQQSRDYGSQANQERAASLAGADSEAATTLARQNLSQDLASYGINPGDERYARTMAGMETQGAAQKAAGMTGAREGVRQMGLSRMQDAVSLGMGTPTQASAAAQGATSAASAGANYASQQRQADAQGIAGAARGAFDLYSAWNGGGHADGGLIERKGLVRAEGYVNKYALGGIVSMKPSAQFTAPPPSGPAGPTRTQQAGNYAGMAAKAYPAANAGAKAAAGEMAPSSYLSTAQGVAGTDAAEAVGTSPAITQSYTASQPGNGFAQLYDAAATKVDSILPQMDGLGTSATGAGVDTAGAGATGLASEGGAGVGAAGTAAGADAAAGAGAMGAAATGAELGTAAGAAAGAGTAVAAEGAAATAAEVAPYLLALAADGGSITSHSAGVQGGEVDGPGGPKDDLIPAMLSDGEFVLPVGTVKKYGLAKLEKMRQEGLEFEKQLGIHKPSRRPAMQGVR